MRCLFVGLGSIGQRHLRNLHLLLGDRVEVMAYRRRGERAVLDDNQRHVAGEDLIAKYGIRIFPDLDEALAANPQVMFVTSPSSLHLEPALRAAEAGCHLFIEKPLSHSLEGIEELICRVEASEIVACVGYQWRFHPAYRRIRDCLALDLIGKILAVRVDVGEYLPAFHPYEDYRRSYAARNELGGGVLLTQIHEFDYLYGLFGLPRRVFAVGGHLSSLEIDVEDVASSLLEYRSKDGAPLPIHVHQDYLQRIPRRRCEIIGEVGTIHWSLSDAFLTRSNDRGEIAERHDYTEYSRNQLFVDELSHFFRCIDGHGSPVVSLRDGVASLRMALAARQSMATGVPVAIESEGNLKAGHA